MYVPTVAQPHLQAELVLHVHVVHVGARQEVLGQQRRVAQALHRAVDVARVAQVSEAHHAVADYALVVRGHLYSSTFLFWDGDGGQWYSGFGIREGGARGMAIPYHHKKRRGTS